MILNTFIKSKKAFGFIALPSLPILDNMKLVLKNMTKNEYFNKMNTNSKANFVCNQVIRVIKESNLKYLVNIRSMVGISGCVGRNYMQHMFGF